MSQDTFKGIIVAFSLDEDVTFTAKQLVACGVPSAQIPNRTPAVIAKQMKQSGPFTEGPLKGFELTGSKAGDGYKLRLGSLYVADIEANGVFEMTWRGEELGKIPQGTLPPDQTINWTKTAETWLYAHVETLKQTFDRATVRRIFLNWLLDLGFKPGPIPAMYLGPASLENALERVIDALPEGTWTTYRAEEYGF